jgi:hypothetical protein
MKEKIGKDTEAAMRLATVHNLAQAAVKQLTEHQRELAAESRELARQ